MSDVEHEFTSDIEEESDIEQESTWTLGTEEESISNIKRLHDNDPTLTYFNVWEPFSDDIAAALKQNTTLASLGIYCKLNMDSVQRVVEVMRENSSINYLIMCNCGIDTEGAR